MVTYVKKVQDFLVKMDFKYTEEDIENGAHLLKFGMKLENKMDVVVSVDEERKTIIVYSVAVQEATKENMKDVAEFITRANYGLIIGNLEMDFNDGEVRYKTSIDLAGQTPEQLTEDMLRSLMFYNFLTLDRYYKGVIAVGLLGENPKEWVEKCEENGSEEEASDNSDN